MKVIRNALEEGVDVTPFASTEYDYMQMEQIKEGIKEGIDISLICNPKYDYSVMRK